jgi:hypothetical protein
MTDGAVIFLANVREELKIRKTWNVPAGDREQIEQIRELLASPERLTMLERRVDVAERALRTMLLRDLHRRERETRASRTLSHDAAAAIAAVALKIPQYFSSDAQTSLTARFDDGVEHWDFVVRTNMDAAATVEAMGRFDDEYWTEAAPLMPWLSVRAVPAARR